MRFDNALTRMTGIQYPIIQGAFGWRGTGTSSIAVPTSEAGGLGILTTISYGGPDEFQEDLRNAKAMTDKPFAVMVSTLDEVEAHCTVSPEEGELLCSPQCPIVLLP